MPVTKVIGNIKDMINSAIKSGGNSNDSSEKLNEILYELKKLNDPTFKISEYYRLYKEKVHKEYNEYILTPEWIKAWEQSIRLGLDNVITRNWCDDYVPYYAYFLFGTKNDLGEIDYKNTIVNFIRREKGKNLLFYNPPK